MTVHRPPDTARALVQANRLQYEVLVDMAERCASAGDTDQVLRAVARAANHAWRAPNGLLADPRLELLVAEAVRGGRDLVVDGLPRAGRVLHVMTESYSTGGHTRQVMGWLSLTDGGGDVALTNQTTPVPGRLLAHLESVGGRLVDLREGAGGLLDRARALRALMDQASYVVLTIHPFDAVALAAVSMPGTRPPVLLVNHADLAFWLGAGSADVVCDWREGAASLSHAVRGVAATRRAVVPIPVFGGDDDLQVGSPADRARVRRALGVGEDRTVALCVADDWKVAPSWGRGMASGVERILHWNPGLVMVLVGIARTEDWARLERRFPGRLHLTGRVMDPGPWFAAADVFVESYPVRAGTTPLEAAAHGLPVLAVVDIPEDHVLHVFQTASPGLRSAVVSPSTEKIGLAVRRVVTAPGAAAELGGATRSAVLAAHGGEGWRRSLTAALDLARSQPAADPLDPTTLHEDPDYAAALLSAVSPGRGLDPRELTDPMGRPDDQTVQDDLFVAFSRHLGPQLQVRVAPGWHDHLPWLRSLLHLCSTRPRLCVSLPFLPEDDAAGSLTEVTLVALLAELGLGPEDCGSLSVEVTRPPHRGPSVSGEPPFTPEVLARLERMLDSPFWDDPIDTEPAPAAPIAAGVGSVTSR